MKNRIIGIIMVLGLALVLVAGCGSPKKIIVTPPTELLVNGGFEDGVLDPWTSDYSAPDCTVVTSTTTAPHSGTYCCMVSNRSAEWNSVEQNIVDTLNELGVGKYHVKFWAKLPSGSQDFYVDLLYKTSVDQQWSTENTTAHVVVETGWTLVEGDIDLNWSGNLYSSTVTFKTFGGSVAPLVYIDDFSMTKVD